MPIDEVFRALNDPTRREILRLLRSRDMTAGEIAERSFVVVQADWPVGRAEQVIRRCSGPRAPRDVSHVDDEDENPRDALQSSHDRPSRGQSACELEEPPHARVSEVGAGAEHHRAGAGDHVDVVLPAILCGFRRHARALSQ